MNTEALEALRKLAERWSKETSVDTCAVNLTIWDDGSGRLTKRLPGINHGTVKEFNTLQELADILKKETKP